MLLNNEWVKNETREEIKKFRETNENEGSEGSPEREVHSNTSLPKKDRNISYKQPNPTSIRTGATTKIAQRKLKEGNNQDQSRIK